MTKLCPKCKDCYMQDADHYYHVGYRGYRCPNCGFNILDGENEESITRRVEARREG
jgi:DNA-directed RNA polymerase subunit RPC12/RpoP